MARTSTCTTCGSSWSGLRACHCSGCHRTFGSVTPFDRHQTLDEDGVVCHDPAERGLEQRERAGADVWVTPMRGDDRWFDGQA